MQQLPGLCNKVASATPTLLHLSKPPRQPPQQLHLKHRASQNGSEINRGVQHLFRVAAQHATRQKGACMPETCRIAFAQLRALHPPCTVHQYQQWCPAVYKLHRILVCCIPCCSRACTRTSGGCDTLEAAHAFRVMHTHDVGGATRQTWLWRGDLLYAVTAVINVSLECFV